MPEMFANRRGWYGWARLAPMSLGIGKSPALRVRVGDIARLAHLFEEIPEMPDYREIACDGMVSLSEIMNRDDCDDQKHESDNQQYRPERSV